MWQYTLSGFVIFFIFTIYRLIYALYFSPLRTIPGPLIARVTSKRGKIDQFSGNVSVRAILDEQKYGEVYVYKPNAVCINHPEDIKSVLGSQDFLKTGFFDIFNDGCVRNVVSMRDPILSSQRRRQIGPYFNFWQLAKMEDLILRHGYKALKTKWDGLMEMNASGQTEVNYRIDTQLVTFDIMSAVAFGRDFGSIRKGSSSVLKWAGVIMSLLDSSFVLALLSLLPFSLVMRPWKTMYHELAVYSDECIQDRKSLLVIKDNKKPMDMLQAFIDAEDPESRAKMTPLEVQAESIMMMLAGSETTSSAIMWTFHLLLLHPFILATAVREIRTTFPSARPYTITFKDVQIKLPYTEACIYEALRHSPTTAGLTPRISYTRSITLHSGHIIPPNTEIYVNLRSPNMHETLWSEPQRFNPDRFLETDSKKSLFTFSYGPRNCIGKNLAWVEMLTIIANVLKDYDIFLPDGNMFGPHNVDENGFPRLLPAKCFIASFPSNPERDCKMIVRKHCE
ncbi:cytochrome p450 monooxygenase [Pseudovirgaria hyperparasitica]|uniref:Cytochrome p450 monooxygenase n=1 Tax=Pseudovirgaria hyperparasitica TaxID=470096 RepID=A0A6A6VUH0_9PEZI|nr:cytochrome p450 monooxygenase [Pseudovirgaria hyperparasitica]KAF2753863.1 cytochrome p450 monooxygenase [Pseudovirgaria hyperparasitica]